MLFVRAFEMTRLTSSSLLSAFAFALLFAGTPSSALAEISESYTDAAESTDGRYLFVSLSTRPLEVELKDEGLTGEERDQIEFFRLHYPASGMYLNDGSNTPVWKFEEPWRGEPIIAPDGEHVIFQGGWTSPSNENELQAVEFTRRGKPIRTYVASDFISSWWLKRLLNGWRSPTCKSSPPSPTVNGCSSGDNGRGKLENVGTTGVHGTGLCQTSSGRLIPTGPFQRCGDIPIACHASSCNPIHEARPASGMPPKCTWPVVPQACAALTAYV